MDRSQQNKGPTKPFRKEGTLVTQCFGTALSPWKGATKRKNHHRAGRGRENLALLYASERDGERGGLTARGLAGALRRVKKTGLSS